MTEIIASLAGIAPRYHTLFCDLWGCLHNGKAPYPAAVAALRSFRARGGRVVLLTNAPRPARFVAATLDRMGVPRDAWDLVVSSGDAAQYAMLHGAVGHRVWHLGPAKDDGFFTDYPPEFAGDHIERVALDQAEGIVCTGPFDELAEVPEDYRDRLLAARDRGLKLLCANPDLVVDMGDRRIYCAGALAALYSEMGGESLYFGKPHAPIYDLARRELAALTGSEPDAAGILAIGDGIATDILGAASEGIDALFVTGGLAADQFGDDVENPSPARLAAWLAAQPAAPAHAIGRLR
ncbi:MAG: TIGR01459 family HAD-type hydrolase [Proteobacteria bacterium]|nr:TIGR01459 family HAD-type hydrolase [Pseudomonadota bacterium]MBS0573784.1 TIGR01459 family HAD-type hydrolase [Pseudomonadota bacterium]